MNFGSVFGQDMTCLLLFSGRCGGAGFEAEAVVSGLQDVAAMRETIEQCSCHLCIPEHAGPFAEAEVGCDDDTGALVKLAQQMEE